MRVLGLLLLLCFPFSLLADSKITTQIHDIDYGPNVGDQILVYLKSGHVVKVPPKMRELIQNLHAGKSQDGWYTFTLDERRYIKGISAARVPRLPGPEDANWEDMGLKSSYVPTTVADLKVAQQYHREGMRNPKESQCFNRAMVWTYDWWKKHSLKSNKILIFFTRNYIRRYDFEWWFHIAPYIHVMDEGKVVERVMDLKYTRGPLSFRQWTDIFMKNDAECPVITKYSEYADFPYTGECYIIRTNMYTYQPADLQMNEAWNYTKTSFNMDEVKAAYKEAFDITL